MKSDNFFAELKRRNVIRMAGLYLVGAWLVVQVAGTVLPMFGAPEWLPRIIVVLLAIAFVPAVIFSWLFELTPEGLKREEDVGPVKSITPRTGRRMDRLIIVVLALALGYFAFDKFVIMPRRERAFLSSAVPNESKSVIKAKSIAVLPFENLSEEKQNEYFADGVQDEILTNLAKIAELKVISRTSVIGYREVANRNLRKIGQELGVAHLLEGSVQRSGNRIRVNAQLIDARSDAHLWAQTYDRDLADVFAIQSEIAKAIADQLQAKLSPNEKAEIEQPPTSDIAAFDLYSRAKTLGLSISFGSLHRQSLFEAVDLLNQAVARDPAFFQAWCLLVYAQGQIYSFHEHTEQRLALAEAALQKAFRLRPDSGEAHLARARNLYYGHRDYEGALAELQVARKSLPNDPRIFEITAYIRRRQGRSEEALQNFQSALELDPRNVFILQQTALSYGNDHQFPAMAATLDRVLSIRPNDVETRAARGMVDLDWKADTRPLHQALDEIRAKGPGAIKKVADYYFTLALAERDATAARDALSALGDNAVTIDTINLGPHFCEGLVGRMANDEAQAHSAFAAAREEQEKIIQAQPDYGPPLCVLALIDAGLGRKEEALAEGRRAIELLPVEKDSINGFHMIENFAIVCAWVGEKDLACEQIARANALPGYGRNTYGQFKLSPFWDSLRGEPCFEKIVADLASKENAENSRK